MSETKNALTIQGVLQQVDAVLAPPPATEPPPYWTGRARSFPQRFLLLDPDTGVVMVGNVHSAALTTLNDARIDRWDNGDPCVRRRQDRQRLDLQLDSMDVRHDPEGYLRRALSMACDMAAQL